MVGLTGLGIARAAAAQAPPSRAETLFQGGLEKMRAGDYASACPDLAASYELEPLPGALFTLAECEASWGKLATALKHYQQFVSTLSSLAPTRRQKFDDRRHLALEQIVTLAPSVPLLSVNVTPGAPADLVVRRDGTVVAESSYGVETPVDPGELVIRAEQGGKTLWQRRVRVTLRDRANIVVPWPPQPTRGVDAPPIPTSRSATLAAGDATDHPPGETGPATDTASSLTTWKYVTAGLGAAGFTVAIVAGSIALAKKGSVDDECSDYRCSQTGLDQANSAKQAARISTVGFIVGLAGAAGFTGLSVFGKPKPEHKQTGSVRVTIDSSTNAGLRLEGSF
jgi:hypothetical protein